MPGGDVEIVHVYMKLVCKIELILGVLGILTVHGIEPMASIVILIKIIVTEHQPIDSKN